MKKNDSLHPTLQALAADFASAILDAIRGASLAELMDTTPVLAGGTTRTKATSAAAPAAPPRPRGRPGRLPRRTGDEIGQAVERIVAVLQKHPEGLRAEQIRVELGLDAKELPRPIAEGLRKKAFKKKGQKRATTYFVRGAKGE